MKNNGAKQAKYNGPKKGYMKKGIKGIIKGNKVFGCANKRTPSKQKLSYIALDTCIIIDMMKIKTGRIRREHNPSYYDNLMSIMQSNAFGKDGRRNPNGKLVLCLLPTVKKELSNEDGEFHTCIQEFLAKNRMLVLDLYEESAKSFDKKASKISREYYNRGFFVDKDKKPMVDGKIRAEAGIFNITLVSRDHHMVPNAKEPKTIHQAEAVKVINRRAMGGSFDASPAETMSPKHLLSELRAGRNLPNLECTHYLDIKTQKLLKEEFDYNPYRSVRTIK